MTGQLTDWISNFCSKGDCVWHNNPGHRSEVLLFGDSHVQFFNFPSDTIDSNGATPDPNYVSW